VDSSGSSFGKSFFRNGASRDMRKSPRKNPIARAKIAMKIIRAVCRSI
jgi:hypothetical protein